MKVCTDACLFGAVVADKILQKEYNPKQILDVGCGTGLLSLMLSQVSDAAIDAVEIEDNAFQQAKENFEENKKHLQITAHHSSITSFNSVKKFDLIICNPPFYENDLRSQSPERNIAMHSGSLTLQSLSASVIRLLAENGRAAILLPYSIHESFSKTLLSDGLFVREKIHIRHNEKTAFIRSIIICSFRESPILESSIEIKNEMNVYSNKFSFLLHRFYLNL